MDADNKDKGEVIYYGFTFVDNRKNQSICYIEYQIASISWIVVKKSQFLLL